MEFAHISVDRAGIFCQPRENGPLRKFHARFERRLGKSFRPIDLAGVWMPHCTIGMELPTAKIGHATNKILGSWAPIAGQLDRLALVKFRPGQVLWRKGLQKS